jgi:hypothetical protein
MGKRVAWRARRAMVAGLIVMVAGSTVWAVTAGASATKPGVRILHGQPGLFAAGRAGFAPTGEELRASALRTRHADRSVQPVTPGAQLPWLRRANANTFLAGSGRLLTKIYPYPVNYRTTGARSLRSTPALWGRGPATCKSRTT